MTELHNYGTESNETFYNERIYIEVVHLGICFVMRPKLTKMIYSLQAIKRPSNEIVGYVSLLARELGRAT